MIKTVYLAHGFEECQVIAREIQADLTRNGVVVLNPFDRSEQPLYNQMVADGVDFNKEVSKKIVMVDLSMIDIADGMVAIPGKTSIGTHMEIFYASHVWRKPVFLLWLHKSTYKHPWLNHLTYYYTDPAQFKTAVLGWANGQ